MKPQYSKWQTQRRCLPDKEWAVAKYHRILVKGCSRLKLTYQLHYLIEESERKKSPFLITVPKGCRVSPEIRQFIREHQYTTLKRVDWSSPPAQQAGPEREGK